MKKTHLLVAAFLLAALCNTIGQTVKVPLTLDRWDTVTRNKEDTLGTQVVRETYLGKECFRLESGTIILKDVDLRDGSFEADISFPRERSFPGFAVRMTDHNNFESFYLR